MFPYLGKALVLRTAQCDFVGVGKCISYCDAPTVTIVTSNGKRITWRADMSAILTEDQEVIDNLFPASEPSRGE